MITNKLRDLFGNEKGAAIIELALVAPIFALMTVGVVDMSNAFSRKLALEQGASARSKRSCRRPAITRSRRR